MTLSLRSITLRAASLNVLVFRLLLAALTLLGVASAAAATPAPTRSFEAGTMHVEQFGDRGSPVILIPGLASGAWVWNDTVPVLVGTHRVYTVTLAGFDGRPAVKGDVIALALESIRELIEREQLKKPVLVGHSLGGTLALDFATTHSDLIGGVVAIDGLPVFPGTENVPAADRAAMAESMRPMMTGASQQAFEAQQLVYMQKLGVANAAKAEPLAKLTSRSDRAATADYAVRDMVLDLRAGLSNIKVAVLEISPYLAADFDARHITEAMKTEYYRRLMPGIAQLEVVSIPDARHFVMVDQPAGVNMALLRFLEKR
jgi:pimeloyl-ACP methyl ester carboxylesterase